MAIMNNKEKKTETNKRINEIDDDDTEEKQEDEESENKKMEMFFTLIKNYQEARKRRRQELIEDSDDAALNPTKRSDGEEKYSGIVPVFRPEDFSHCIDLNLKPPNPIVPTDNNQEEQEEKKQNQTETDKETRQDNGLDLNLAL